MRLGCYLRKHRDWFAGVGIEYQYFREEYRRIHGFRKAAGSEAYVPDTAVPETRSEPAPAMPAKPAMPAEASAVSTVASVEPATASGTSPVAEADCESAASHANKTSHASQIRRDKPAIDGEGAPRKTGDIRLPGDLAHGNVFLS